MKNINYKELRKYLNLPKYDLGMSSGYQGGDKFVFGGKSESLAPNITNTLLPSAITKGIEGFTNTASIASPFVKDAWDTLKNLRTGIEMKPVEAIKINPFVGEAGITKVGTGGDIFTGLQNTTLPGTPVQGAAENAVENAGTNTSNTAVGKGIGAAAKVASIVLSAKGGLDMYKLMTENKGLSGDDILLYTGKSTGDANGVLYDMYTGWDKAGMDKLKKNMVTSSVIEGVTYGNELAEAPADLLSAPTAGLSQLLRIPFMALGGLAGLFRGKHMLRELEKRENEMRLAFNGYNRQSEAEAANKGIQNNFYGSHYVADSGLRRCDNGIKPALMGPLETQIETYEDPNTGNTRIKLAYTPNETPDSKWREDNILTFTTPNTAIIGNNKDADTGIPFSLEALPAVEQFNSADPYESQVGELMLLNIINKQSKKSKNVRNPKSDNDPGKYGVVTADKGLDMRRIKKYDYGEVPKFSNLAPYALIPGLAKVTYNLLQFLNDKKTPVTAFNPYVENSLILSILAGYPTNVDIKELRDALNSTTRQRLYTAGQTGSISSGLRRALLDQAYSDHIKALLSLFDAKNKQMHELMRNRTLLAAQLSDQDATRQMQGNSAWARDFASAAGKKYSNMDAHGSGAVAGLGDIGGNLSTLQQFLYNIGLWREEVDNKRLATVLQANKKAV